jgi:uncharacterized protein YbjT (DUF2867 family)
MRIAVIGATGLVGRAVLEALGRHGHEGVAVSRSAGVDVVSGEGLDAAVAGCESIVDVLNTPDNDGEGPQRFFTAATRNLLRAGSRDDRASDPVPRLRRHRGVVDAGRRLGVRAAAARPARRRR